MKILWVSRHELTNEQLEDLHRIYGDFELMQLDKTIKDIKEILQIKADVYAVVLPINLLIKLKNSTTSDIIQSVSERIVTENKILNPATNVYEPQYMFKHLYWEKIIKAEIQTEQL